MNETRKYGGFALAFFVGGLILSLVLLSNILGGFRTMEPITAIAALVCELLAVLLGVLGWREKRCKVVVALTTILIFGTIVWAAIPREAVPEAVQAFMN